MWIFLGILAVLAALIAAVLLLPVNFIIKNDEKNKLVFKVKVLFFTFGAGEGKGSGGSAMQAVKENTGISRLEKSGLKNSIEQNGFFATVSQTCHILADFIKEFTGVLRFCTAKKLRLEIICSSDDAAEAAINYGKLCALVYPLTGLADSVMRVQRKNMNVNIACDYSGAKQVFNYDLVIAVRVAHLLAALLRIVFAEARRTADSAKQEP